MLTPWRFKLREAQVAVEQGRLDEAAALLTAGDLRQYLPVKNTLAEIAKQTARRGFERAAAGDLATGWRDLDRARELAGETSDWLEASRALADLAINEIVNYLRAGDYAAAQQRIEALEKRKIAGLPLSSLREVTRRLESARKLAQRGKFADALQQVSAAETLRSDLTLIAEQKKLYAEHAERTRGLNEQLHASLAQFDWTKVLSLASELLEISPEHRVARDARRRAWAEVGEQIGDSRHAKDTHHWAGLSGERQASASRLDSPARPAPRFMLWIDAVGGFLVCLGNEITVGQAFPGSRVDVPIQADISRKHIKIRRQGEGYVLEPLAAKVKLEGKSISSPALLSDGNEITLGEAVKLVFRKPHVLSASARLELTSPHRTQPYADAILLMAESCVLGPKWQNHVVCRDWGGDVVMYRQDDNLFCRAMQSIEIDGKLHDGRGLVKPGSHVLGTDFSMTLEALE